MAVTENLDKILPFFVTAWILLVALTAWKPQRFKNAFVLMIALFFTMLTIASLFGSEIWRPIIATAIFIVAALIFTPILLTWNGILIIKREGKSAANMLSLLLGIGIGIGEIAWFITIFSNVLLSAPKWVYAVVLLLGLTVFYLSFILLTFVVYSLYIQYIPKTINFDYVIIHGCGLANGKDVTPLLAARIDKAIEVYRQSKIKPVLIPSGGRGDDESLSEAEAMKKYFLEKGIPEKDIYCEDKSTTTMENLANCKSYIEQQGEKKKIALVSSNYHIYRCMLYADKIKMRCIGIGSHVALYYWPSALIREFIAVFTRPSYLVWTLVGYVFLIFIPILQMVY